MKLFILATCRDVSLLPFTTLVFDSIRVGFPTVDIHVHGNALGEDVKGAVALACERAGAEFSDHLTTIHHLWLEQLCETQQEPFWICDTDVIFYESVEGWKFEGKKALAGWRIPEWNDEFTGARTRARLHTSLLYVDPIRLRYDLTAYRAWFPVTAFNPFPNIFYPLCVPFKGGAYFYDTAAFLYHAVGGQEFTERQLDAYHHMFFGTIPDIVLPRLKNGEAMAAARDEIMKNPLLGKGNWRSQMRYYENRQ